MARSAGTANSLRAIQATSSFAAWPVAASHFTYRTTPPYAPEYGFRVERRMAARAGAGAGGNAGAGCDGAAPDAVAPVDTPTAATDGAHVLRVRTMHDGELPPTGAVTAALRDLVAKPGVPGAACCVAWWHPEEQGRGKLGELRVWTASDGVRRVDADPAADPTAVCHNDDAWHLGSCTKAFTATLIASHIDRAAGSDSAHALTWDSRVGAILAPAIDAAGLPAIHASLRDTTLVQLLTHTSGLTKRPPRAAWDLCWDRDTHSRDGLASDGVAIPAAATSPECMADRLAFVAAVLHEPAGFESGSKKEYSNWNYVVASAMLEAVTGESWETLIARDLFAPLGMRHVMFGPAGRWAPTLEARQRFVWGHRAESQPAGQPPKLVAVDPAAKADNPTGMSPAGRLSASLEDWARFAATVCSAHAMEALLGIRPATRAFMLTKAVVGDSCPGGWVVADREWAGDGPALNHAGSNVMNYCSAWCSPARGGVLLATSNAMTRDTKAGLDTVHAAMLRWLFQEGGVLAQGDAKTTPTAAVPKAACCE